MKGDAHKTLAKVVTFLASVSGRNRIARFLQYFSKWLQTVFKFYSLRLGGHPGLEFYAEKASKLASSMSNTRKVLRWGNVTKMVHLCLQMIDEYNSPRTPEDRYKASKNPYIHYLRLASNICNAGYYTCDHVTYLYGLTWIRNEKLNDKAGYSGSVFWFINILCMIAADIQEIILLNEFIANEKMSQGNGAKAEDSAKIEKAKKRIWDCKYEIIQCLIDTPCALHYVSSYKWFSPGLVYFLSSVTSVMQAYTAWPKK